VEEMHLLGILPDHKGRERSVSQPVSVSHRCSGWSLEGLLHERKVAALSAFKFWISFTAGTSFTRADNSAILISHITLFSGNTIPGTSIFALAVCWSGKSILIILLARFNNKKLEKN
jgi:hypothetical protein